MEESRRINTVTLLTKTFFMMRSLNIGLSLRERTNGRDDQTFPLGWGLKLSADTI